MKKIFLKTLTAFFAIVLLVQPLLQIKKNTNVVYAASEGWYSSESAVQNSLGKDEYYEITKWEYRYFVTYKVHCNVSNVPDCIYKFLKAGQSISTPAVGGSASITNNGSDFVDYKKHYTGGVYYHKENYYNVRFDAVKTYDTGWAKNPVIPDVYVVGNFGSYGNYVKVNSKMYVDSKTRSTRCYAKIYKKQGSGNNSGNNSGNYSGGNSGNYSGGNSENYSGGNSGNYSGGTSTPMYSSADIAEEKVNLSDDQKRLYIRRLYKMVLNKEPGIDYIEDQLKRKNLQQFSYGVILGEESKKINNIENIDNTTYVKSTYYNIMGKEISSSNLNTYVNMLNNGYTRVNLIRLLINSDDFEKIWGSKTVKTLKFSDADLCWGVWEWIKNPANHNKYNYDIVKKDRNTLIMFQDEVNKIKQVKINNKGLVDDLTGISAFTNLEHLSVPNNKISNFNELTKLSKLRILDISGNGNLHGKLDPIWKLTNLTELRINNASLVDSDINANINKLTKLNYLYLNNNSITDLTSISQMSSLKKIFMSGNKVTNLGNIDSLKLDDLSLSDTKLNCITTLNTETQNEEVYVPFLAKVQDSKSYLYSKGGLECTNCKVENGKVIMDFNASTAQVKVKEGHATRSVITISKNTQKIVLNDKALVDRLTRVASPFVLATEEKDGKYTLTVLSSRLYQLQNLNLTPKADEAKIKDITGLENFTNLKYLNLSGNEVQNLEKLKDVKSLETLIVRNCGLTNLNGVKDMTNLIQIDAAENSITNVEPLSNLTELNSVILSSNNIGNNLEPLNKLSKLSILSIDNNNISDLSSLSNLKLDSLYASYNSISSLHGINTDNVETLRIKNNNIDLTVGGDQAEIPDVLAKAIEESGVENNLELTNCTISNNKIKLNDGSSKAQVKIKKGSCSDTVINVSSTQSQLTTKVVYGQTINNVSKYYTKDTLTDADIEELGINKNEITKLNSNDTVEFDGAVGQVFVLANRKISTNSTQGNIRGTIGGKTGRVLTLNFLYNVEDYNVRVCDEFGNSAIAKLTFSGLHYNTGLASSTQEVKNDIKVKYSESIPTKNDVTATITIKEDTLHLFDVDQERGWKLSSDGKSIYKTFTQNTTEAETVRIMTETEYGHTTHGPVNTTIEVLNIDKTAPTSTIEYNNVENSKSSVRATIWSDEEIELVNESNRFISKVSREDQNNKTQYGILLYYNDNADEDIRIKDLAGNESTAHVTINNIDKSVDGLNAQSSNAAATNQPVTVTLNANEAIKNVTAGSNQASNSNSVFASLRKTFRLNEPTIVAAASLKAVPVMEGNSNLNEIAYVSDVNLGLVTRVAENEENESNSLSVELPEGFYGAIEAEDNAGNSDLALYNTNNIDTMAPLVNRETDKTNSDGSVLVTLVANEQLQNTEALAGWTLGNDKKTLTRVFNKNQSETLTVKDLAGNESTINIDVKGIEKIPYTVEVTPIENTDRYLVTISTDSELQEVEGWNLSEDKKSLSREMCDGEEEIVLIEDYYGNGSEVYIYLGSAEDNNSEDGTEENNEQADQQNQEDNTQSDKTLPQTGSYAMFTGGLIIILTALTFVTLRNYKKNIEN